MSLLIIHSKFEFFLTPPPPFCTMSFILQFVFFEGIPNPQCSMVVSGTKIISKEKDWHWFQPNWRRGALQSVKVKFWAILHSKIKIFAFFWRFFKALSVGLQSSPACQIYQCRKKFLFCKENFALHFWATGDFLESQNWPMQIQNLMIGAF